jgi:hypothetical protein
MQLAFEADEGEEDLVDALREQRRLERRMLRDMERNRVDEGVEARRQYAASMRQHRELRSWRREREWQSGREEERERAARRVHRGTPSVVQEMQTFGYSANFSMPNKAADGLEQVTASSDFDPTRLFLKRVTACVGWAVHGLVFEYVDGKRMGYIIDGGGDHYVDLVDDGINRRQGRKWTDVQYGDYVVGIHGNRLVNAIKPWLCQTVALEFASGMTVRYEANHEPWRGEPFSLKVPQPCLVYRITFGHHQEQDMRGLITTLHLPLSPENLLLLPTKHQQAVQETFNAVQQVDEIVESSGQMPLGDDLWWHILGMLTAWQLHLPPPKKKDCPLEKEKNRVQRGWDHDVLHRLDKATTEEFLRIFFHDEEAAFEFLEQKGGDDEAMRELLTSMEESHL